MLSAITSKISAARSRKAALLTVLAGMVSVLGHAPFFVWPVFVICFGGFFLRLDSSESRAALNASAATTGRQIFWAGARTGYLFGFGYFLASLYWIASAFITRGTGYILLAPFGMLLLPAGLAFFWGLAGGIYTRLTFKRAFGPVSKALLFTCLFFTAEYLRGNILSGFPWNLPGYIWKAGGAMSQSASLFGIYGLSLITVFLGASFGAAFLMARRSRFIPVVLSGLICVTLFGFGTQRLSNAQINYVDGPYIRVLQTRLEQQTKFSTASYFDVINKYLALSDQPADKPLSHVIWPEGAIPGLPLEDSGLMDAINSLFETGPDLIMGVTRREQSTLGETRYYNSVIGLRADPSSDTPREIGLYNKSRLVPFGEYFPGNTLVESFNIPALTAATSSFNFGTPGVTGFPNLPVSSVQICYEAIFTRFTPKDEAIRPQWILTVSNDAWFGNSTGPYQHMNQVQYRAIEEGLPIVRSASSGLSGFIGPYGRRLKTLPLHDEGVIDSALPAPIAPPFYARLGN